MVVRKVTDRRVILLKGNETYAARGEKVAAYPRSAVTVAAGESAAKSKCLELQIRGVEIDRPHTPGGRTPSALHGAKLAARVGGQLAMNRI